jgi:Lipase
MVNSQNIFFIVNSHIRNISVCIASPIDYRWNLMPDGDGRMHLIDAAPNENLAEAFFNAEVDTRFLLFTRSNPTAGQRITWTSASISGSNFNSAHPTRILIHGFNSGPSSGVNIAPTAAYLQRGNFNVIV